METSTTDRDYIDGVWRDVPMVAGMELGSTPYANAVYEINVVQAKNAKEPFRSMAMYQARRAWGARAKARGLDCPMPADAV